MNMDPLTIATIAQGTANLGGGILGYLGQRQTNKTNIQLAREARQHDVNMWNMQNAYNTPQMQMQRFKEAGLNPNLIYGQTNVASQPQKSPVPQVDNELAALSQALQVPFISMYQDFQVKDAQLDKLKAEADATRQLATLRNLEQLTKSFTNRRLEAESPFWSENAMMRSNIIQGQREKTRFEALYKRDSYPALIKQIGLRNLLLEEQTKGQRLENQLNEQLKPYGATSRDPLLHRLIMYYAPKILKQFTK